MTTAAPSIGLDIIDALCAGMKPKDIQTKLSVTSSVFESRFEAIREAAGLPKEKRAYVACSALVQENLNQLHDFMVAQELAMAEFKASLNQFNY